MTRALAIAFIIGIALILWALQADACDINIREGAFHVLDT